MSQHDFDIANQSSSNARVDINSALKALASLSSGATAPATTYANMLWYDTSSNILKMRSEADDAWISMGYLDQSTNTFKLLDDTQVVDTSGTQTGLLGDQATSVWETGTATTESLVSPAKIKAAIAANPTGIGVNQTWQDMSAYRDSESTVYQNTTGKPIQVSIMYSGDFNSSYFEVSANNVNWVRVYFDQSDGGPVPMTGVVIPDQHYYRSKTNGGTNDPEWFELR